MAVSSWVQSSGAVTLGGPAWLVLWPQARCVRGPLSGRVGFQHRLLTALLAEQPGSFVHSLTALCPLPLAQMTQKQPLGESHPPGRTWAQGSLSHKATSDGQKPSAIQSLLQRRRRGIGRPLFREGESGDLWTYLKADPSASRAYADPNRRCHRSGSGESCGPVAVAHGAGRQAEASLGLELFIRKKNRTLHFMKDVR